MCCKCNFFETSLCSVTGSLMCVELKRGGSSCSVVTGKCNIMFKENSHHKQYDWQRVNFSLGRAKPIGDGNSLISALLSFMLHYNVKGDLRFCLVMASAFLIQLEYTRTFSPAFIIPSQQGLIYHVTIGLWICKPEMMHICRIFSTLNCLSEFIVN